MATRQRRLNTSTWLLAAALLALGLYAYFVELRGGERRERAETRATQLLSFRSDTATELVLEQPNQRIVCKKKDGKWHILAPIHTDADEGTVERILTDVAESKIDRTVTERPGDLAAFGLLHPLIVTVAAGAARQSILVGRENPTGNFVFARRGAGENLAPVLLVDRRLRDAAEKKLYDLREKSVLDFSPEDVQAIIFTHAGQQTRLTRRPAAKDETQPGWELVEPLRARADRGQVERSLDLISSLRAEAFVSEKSENLQRYGFDGSPDSVRFDLKGKQVQALLIGRKTEEGALTRYFARHPGSGPIFTINDNLPRDAQQPAEQWRERHVTDFNRADVAELRLMTPGRTVVCAKKLDPNSADWGLAEFSGRVAEGMNLAAAAKLPTAQRAERTKIDDLLGHLGALEVKSFLDNANTYDRDFGLQQPALKVVALDAAGKTLASLGVGKQKGNLYYARSTHLESVFTISADEVSRFRISAREIAARS